MILYTLKPTKEEISMPKPKDKGDPTTENATTNSSVKAPLAPKKKKAKKPKLKKSD